MNIHFETSVFEKDPKGLISVLCNLHRIGFWSVDHYRDIERVVCRTPSSALNYCRYVNGAFGVSREAERVFLKNPVLGIRYLRLVNRRSFLDPDTQSRFWRKVVKNPHSCYQWCHLFRERVSAEEEEVFGGDIPVAVDYAFFIIKAPFSEKVHNMLIMSSFGDMDDWSRKKLRSYMEWSNTFDSNGRKIAAPVVLASKS